MHIVGNNSESVFENSIEILNVLLFWTFPTTKNMAFRNKTIFYNNFFRVAGGGGFPPSPLTVPLPDTSATFDDVCSKGANLKAYKNLSKSLKYP